MTVLVANNAVSRLAGGLSSAATTLGVMTGDGASFPAVADGNWFPLTLVKSDGSLEIVKCTARTLDAFTIVRAQEGTQAIEFSAGDRVELRLTKAAVGELQEKTASAQSAADNAASAASGAQTTANGAASAASAAGSAVAALDSIAVKKDSATGAAFLPEGDDAQRPATGSIPAGALVMRGNTQDPADYKPEFWDRVAAGWKVFADRAWVTAAITALQNWVNTLIGFTIIYPNGGTEAAPANAAINSRYVVANPFSGHQVLCVAEILVNGKWGASGFAYSTSGGGYLTNATQWGDEIVIQTGLAGVAAQSNASGNAFGIATNVTAPTPFRVKVWIVKGVVA